MKSAILKLHSELKRQKPGKLIILRVGDFYELFYEDARTAARVLGLTLTTWGRKNDPNPVPMCGFPYHQLSNYMHCLADAGIDFMVS